MARYLFKIRKWVNVFGFNLTVRDASRYDNTMLMRIETSQFTLTPICSCRIETIIISRTMFYRFVCSGCRCPESMWLFNNPGHNYSSFASVDDYPLDYDYSITPIMAHTTVGNDYDAKKHSDQHRDAELTEPTKNSDSGSNVGQVSSPTNTTPSKKYNFIV